MGKREERLPENLKQSSKLNPPPYTVAAFKVPIRHCLIK